MVGQTGVIKTDQISPRRELPQPSDHFGGVVENDNVVAEQIFGQASLHLINAMRLVVQNDDAGAH
jgi:hypothetical protein